MTKFFYFKVTFLSVAAGLSVGMLVYGLFEVDFSDSDAILKLVVKSLITGIATGLILGFFNMFAKIGNFKKKES